MKETNENPNNAWFLIVASGLISGNYDNGGGTSDINALKSKHIYITFSLYLTENTVFQLNTVGDRSTGKLKFTLRFILNI